MNTSCAIPQFAGSKRARARRIVLLVGLKKFSRLVSLLTALLLTACDRKTTHDVGPTYPHIVVGNLSREEVTVLGEIIGNLTFPTSIERLIALLPSKLTPDNVAIYEVTIRGNDEAGRNGGRVEDYWLNKDHVVRIGIAYYPDKGLLVEWAVILGAKERETYKRLPYPSLGKSNQP